VRVRVAQSPWFWDSAALPAPPEPSAWHLLAWVSVPFGLTWEGRGFSPAARNGLLVGALAPEATLFQGLKAPSTRALRIGGAKAPPFL